MLSISRGFIILSFLVYLSHVGYKIRFYLYHYVIHRRWFRRQTGQEVYAYEQADE